MRLSAWCAVCVMSLSTTVISAAEWAGFRGPAPSDLNEATLPLTWTPESQIRWTATLAGIGQSSPVIWGDQIYLTTVEGPKKETCHISAFRLSDGSPLWRGSVKNSTPEEVTGLISKAAPTPVVNSQGVIALFEGGNLLALTHAGEKRWEKDLVAEFGPIHSRHGLGSSLIQTDENVVVWIERDNEPYLLCLNKTSGETTWKVNGMGATSWSSPIILTVNGKQQLVFSASGKLRGVDPSTGEELWLMEGITGNATPSPSAVGDGVLLLGATDARGESSDSKPAQSNCLVRVKPTDDGKFETEFVWRAKRATCSFGSPIVHQGLAYFVNRQGILFCLDAATGEEVYAERTPESCWATPLAVGDRIYLVGQKGTTTVIKAGRTFEILASNRLWIDEAPASEGGERSAEGRPMGDRGEGRTPSRGGPGGGGGGMGYGTSDSKIQFAVAAVPGSLLIRTGDKLFCVGNTTQENAK